MGLVFETAAARPSPPGRTDVACFVGFVARRREVRLPSVVRAQLAADGWVNGPWRRGPEGIEALDNLPVVIDSWALFDQLFAWEQRPVSRTPDPVSGRIACCATYLGAAVRSFFARGGRRAIVIRVGDPWVFLESAAARTTKRRARLHRLLPDFADGDMAPVIFDATDPASWRGVHHLAGLREASMLCLPDLPDACSTETPAPPTGLQLSAPPEGFVECSEVEAALPADNGLRALSAPRLDSRGYGPWRVFISAVRRHLARHQREVMLLAALPLPHDDARRPGNEGGVHAQTNMLAFLRRAGVFETAGHYAASDLSVASAFVQLAWPWLNTRASLDLPEGLESPDGMLAGLLATNALTRGTYRSAAGDFSLPRLRDVQDATPAPAWGAGPESPIEQLARRVCVFAPQPGGWALQSDVTTSVTEAWRFGGASRLMGAVLREARRSGESVLFDANGQALWQSVRRNIEATLERFWRTGGLDGSTPAEAFVVRCDRSTMTQNDLDHGRVKVEISVRPAMSIERITVVLALNGPGATTSNVRGVS
jgi:hypothetical protein